NDRMASCFTQAVARVEVSAWPRFEGVRAEIASALGRPSRSRSRSRQAGAAELETIAADHPARAYHDALRFLSQLEPTEGIIARSYAPSGKAGRRYYTDENARRIDAALHHVRRWCRAGRLERGEHHLLLASLLNAADRVANISGTYGAYLKRWQASSLAPLTLRPIEIFESDLPHQAFRGDANELITRIEGDVLYVDPPYNHRQYPANYHVLEVIAEYPDVADPELYEASLYGKTGLRPYKDQRSSYCVSTWSSRSELGDARSAMHHLLTTANVRHIVVSYNEEGILGIDDFAEILAEVSGSTTSRVRADLTRIAYRRFRSDSDREPSAGQNGRRYRQLSGRGRDGIEEWLFYARSSRARTRSRAL